MVVKNVELPEYSVLMSVYAGEKPEHLRTSIESMLSQTYVTNDFADSRMVQIVGFPDF